MSNQKKHRYNGLHVRSDRERGVVLMVALIALVALTLAGIALVRSVDTGNVVAGNMAFRAAALHHTDIGVEAAFVALPNIVATSKDANIANQYYALRQPVDSRGVPNPSGLNWANVPCRNSANTTVDCSTQDYQVKYIIDRLCEQQMSGSTIVTDVQNYCFADLGSGKGGSKGSFGTVFSSVDAIYYRVTVQVTGPRNTTAYVQAVMTKG